MTVAAHSQGLPPAPSCGAGRSTSKETVPKMATARKIPSFVLPRSTRRPRRAWFDGVVRVACGAALFSFPQMGLAQPAIGFPDPDPGAEIRLIDAREGDRDHRFPVMIHGYASWMNVRGEMLARPEFTWTDYDHDGVIRVVVDRFTGYRADGEWLAEPLRDGGDRFNEGFAVVQDDGKYGFLKRDGEMMTDYIYDDARRFSEGMAIVRRGTSCGYIDRRGREVIPPRYAVARSFSEGLAAVFRAGYRGQPGRWSYLDTTGREVYSDTEQRFVALGDFRDGLAPAQAHVDGDPESPALWGFINHEFEWVIPPTFEAAESFVNDRAAVKVGTAWGYIDPTGAMVIGAGFEEVYPFDDVLALVCRGGRYGYLDRNGGLVVPPTFVAAEPFFRGLARVSDGQAWGYVDVNGSMIWHPQVASRGYRDQRAEAQSNGPAPFVAAPPRRREAEPFPPDHLYQPFIDARRRRR